MEMDPTDINYTHQAGDPADYEGVENDARVQAMSASQEYTTSASVYDGTSAMNHPAQYAYPASNQYDQRNYNMNQSYSHSNSQNNCQNSLM